MTEVELIAVVKGITPAIKAAIQAGLAGLDTRLLALETRPLPKEGSPGPCGERGQEGTPGPAGATGPDGPAGTPGRDGRDGLPGVPGVPGEKGVDGTNGKDGADGLGFDDLDEKMEDGGRFLVRTYRAGDRVKVFRHQTAMPVYRGVYQSAKAYDVGDVVTSSNQMWYCAEPTSMIAPNGGVKAWQLCVRGGRDGKDGKDAPSLPVVKVR